MGVYQNCAGIETEVTTKEECREAAKDLRLPLGYPGSFHGFWYQRVPRNCMVYQNKVWFNGDLSKAPCSNNNITITIKITITITSK